MKKRDVEKRLKTAFASATPNVLSAVLSDCASEKGTVMKMTKTSKNPAWVRRAAAMAAALVLIVGGAFGFSAYRATHAVASVISLDVNPSLEIKVNKHEKVLDVIALNEEAQIVIGSMDFRDSSLEVTINALIGSMLRNGYLDDLANSILVTVDNDDAAKGEALRRRLADEIAAALQTSAFSGAVVSQTIGADAALDDLAAQNGISKGKAQLIQQLVAQNTLYSFEELAVLSVNELNLLLTANNTPLENGEVTGIASEKSYIGTEKALDAALAHANVLPADVRHSWVELDFDDGKIVYEVEFYVNGIEYEYEIGAVDGTIVKAELDEHRQVAAPVEPIGAAAAKTAALTHAGVDAANARFEKVELDEDDGVAYYEVEFIADRVKYDYIIAAVDATVLRYKCEPIVLAPADTADAAIIGPERAKEIALAYAGVSAADAQFEKAELDRDDGVLSYELEFYANGVEYEADINVLTGAIIDFVRDDKNAQRPAQTTPAVTTSPVTEPPITTTQPATTFVPQTTPATTTQGQISAEQAKSIALERAGVSAADARFEKVELDYDDGRAHYEIEFSVGNVEYEADVDAVTGAIIEFERDIDD
ncbi:MAG: cell wall protein [Ruminococcaceae bacterium]|nr:cell wall protein [Oscillospiraceae bacterium]